MTTPVIAARPLVLLVDDDADVLELGRRALEQLGYRVACRFDVDEALAGMAEERPDVVVTDLMMQRLDSGFDLARRMKADPGLRGVPVIVMTGVARQLGLDFHPRDERDLVAMQVEGYLEKPVRAAALGAAVARALARAGGVGTGERRPGDCP